MKKRIQKKNAELVFVSYNFFSYKLRTKSLVLKFGENKFDSIAVYNELIVPGNNFLFLLNRFLFVFLPYKLMLNPFFSSCNKNCSTICPPLLGKFPHLSFISNWFANADQLMTVFSFHWVAYNLIYISICHAL